MIKSVHLTNYYHKNSGGISTSYNNLLAAAERHKRQIRLIVPGEIEEIEIVNDYAKIYYVPAKFSPVFDKRYRIILPWQYMPNDTLIRKILLEEKPDLIEVTDKYTLSMLGAMIRIGKFKQLNRPMLVHFSCETNGRQYRFVYEQRQIRTMARQKYYRKIHSADVRFSYRQFAIHGGRIL